MVILGVRYHNLTRRSALNRALSLADGSEKNQIFFLNLDCLYNALNDADYRQALSSSSLTLPDGIGIKLATRLFGGRMKENLNGTDFSPLLMSELTERGHKIYLLGGKEGVAKAAADVLRERIPAIQIVGAESGFFEGDDAVQSINQSGATVLFVGMGVPKQEKWIMQNREKLKPQLCLGVGALFDWISGAQMRSPLVFRRLNLEWFWRVLIEPRRMFKRYIVRDLPFLMVLLFSRSKTS